MDNKHRYDEQFWSCVQTLIVYKRSRVVVQDRSKTLASMLAMHGHRLSHLKHVGIAQRF